MSESMEATSDTPQTAVTVSARAAKQIAKILAKEPAPKMLRVSVSGGGCSGFQYNFDLTETRNDDDLAIERHALLFLRRQLAVAVEPLYALGNPFTIGLEMKIERMPADQILGPLSLEQRNRLVVHVNDDSVAENQHGVGHMLHQAPVAIVAFLDVGARLEPGDLPAKRANLVKKLLFRLSVIRCWHHATSGGKPTFNLP